MSFEVSFGQKSDHPITPCSRTFIDLKWLLVVARWCVQNNIVTARSCVFDRTIYSVSGWVVSFCWPRLS